MLTVKRYSLKNVSMWTRGETLVFFIYASVITFLYGILDLTFLNIPWTPIALIGTAVAFVIGFRNNSAYGRIWEARKIWGGIVNTSRMWGMNIRDMISEKHSQDSLSKEEHHNFVKTFVFRHIAWLTALRYAMRESRKWEVFDEQKTNREWSDIVHIPERVSDLKETLLCYISEEECEYVLTKKNKPAALLYLQSKNLKELKDRGFIWEFAFLELEKLLNEMFTLQGKSERIKNFPYPRQYATLSHYFVWTFILLLPFGIIPEFSKIGLKMIDTFPLVGEHFVWVGTLFCVVVSWVFHTMERIGRVGENPFEGTANDVPISTISRGIEIDLRQLMDEDEENIPIQFPEKYNVQM